MSSEALSLEYGCSEWRRSSQLASNHFNAGDKLWTKDDLRDIEQQLGDSENRSYFTVRLIDGTRASIKNPMFGEQLPIWQPRVKYHDYWRLVKAQPEGPPETYRCSYLVHWDNICARRFRGVIQGSSSMFKDSRHTWNQSISCRWLRSQLEGSVSLGEVTKIICFGLGDMCRKPPEWLKRLKTSSDDDVEASFVRPSMVQHSIALSIAEMCHNITANKVQLLAQDPDYTEEAKGLLERNGFSIVGQYGAAGFAEIDDNSVIFAVFVEAPLKQIIADIARPRLVISTGFEVFNNSEKPLADAESPRTKEMWEGYDRFDFPVAPEDEEMLNRLRGIYLYVRKAAGLRNDLSKGS